MLEKVFFTQASLDENGPNVRHVKEKWAACSGEGYALGCEWLAVLDARAQARRMAMPTLIMLGSNEGQPFKDAAKWIDENIPGSKGIVEVPMAGHASVRERPEFAVQEFRAVLELDRILSRPYLTLRSIAQRCVSKGGREHGASLPILRDGAARLLRMRLVWLRRISRDHRISGLPPIRSRAQEPRLGVQ